MPKMDEGQFKNFLTNEITTALSYIDSIIAYRRELILSYIQLEMIDLPAMKGRSESCASSIRTAARQSFSACAIIAASRFAGSVRIN